MQTYTAVHSTMANSTKKDEYWEVTVRVWIQDHSAEQVSHLTAQKDHKATPAGVLEQPLTGL